MRPTSDQPSPHEAGGAAGRRLSRRAAAFAAAAIAGVSPASARAEPVAETSLTPGGSQVGDGLLPRGHQPVVRVVDVAPDGSRGHAVTISDKSRPARLIGGTQVKAGAVAVAFDQALGDGRWEPRLAYRPAGSSQFLPSVPTGPAHRGATSEQVDPVVLGPDGTGIVLGFGSTHRDSFVRRLAADGSLGPAIVIAPRSIGSVVARAEVSATGAVAIAIAASRSVPGVYDEEPTFESSIYATTLPAGAARPTPLQHLATVDNPDEALLELAVALDEAGDAIVEASLPGGPTRTWAGPAEALGPA